LREHIVVFLSRERGFSECKQMEDDPYTKEIANGSILCLKIFKVYNFRSHISRSSTSHEHVILSRNLCKSKISNNTVKVALLPEKYILRFEISMHDVISVHDFESL
jgi:hypothetical protein